MTSPVLTVKAPELVTAPTWPPGAGVLHGTVTRMVPPHPRFPPGSPWPCPCLSCVIRPWDVLGLWPMEAGPKSGPRVSTGPVSHRGPGMLGPRLGKGVTSSPLWREVAITEPRTPASPHLTPGRQQLWATYPGPPQPGKGQERGRGAGPGCPSLSMGCWEAPSSPRSLGTGTGVCGDSRYQSARQPWRSVRVRRPPACLPPNQTTCSHVAHRQV